MIIQYAPLSDLNSTIDNCIISISILICVLFLSITDFCTSYEFRCYKEFYGEFKYI